jgi:hypothetical protein
MEEEIVFPRRIANGRQINLTESRKTRRINADRRKALKYCWECEKINRCTKMRTCAKTRHLFKDEK